MLGQYKKIAIIETLVQKIDIPSQRSLTIPLNLEFTPTRILLHAWTGSETLYIETYIDSKWKETKIHHAQNQNGSTYYRNLYINLNKFDNSVLELNLDGSNTWTFTNITFEIIAIG